MSSPNRLVRQLVQVQVSLTVRRQCEIRSLACSSLIGRFQVSVSFFSPSGFKLKHFLQDEETLSSFLLRNASFSEYAVRQITEANVNLKKVRSCFAHAQSEHSITKTTHAVFS